MKDLSTSFMIYKNNYRGRLIRLDKSIKQITTNHSYPLPITNVVAEGTTLAATLASTIKYDGLFTLQTQSNGPISQLVVDVTSNGLIRACTNYNKTKLDKAQTLRKVLGQIEPAPNLMGGGQLAFTVYQGKDTQLYQGIVELKGKTFEDLILKYFVQSEQIDTYIKLYTDHSKGLQTACLILQKMPGNSEEDAKNWEEAKILADSLKEEELFTENLSNSQILHRLFHNSDLTIGEEKSYKFQCRCSKDKLQTTLSGFSKEEIDDIAKDNKIQVKCEFCSTQYIFEKGELLTQ